MVTIKNNKRYGPLPRQELEGNQESHLEIQESIQQVLQDFYNVIENPDSTVLNRDGWQNEYLSNYLSKMDPIQQDDKEEDEEEEDEFQVILDNHNYIPPLSIYSTTNTK